MAVEQHKILLESGTNELEVMEFMVADRHFGINVSKVFEIRKYHDEDVPIVPMPNSNPFVEGIFKSRDAVLTIVNLAAYMGLPPSASEERDILIISVFNKVQTAFHVHSVQIIHKISWEAIEKPDPAIYGGDEGLATGIAHVDGRLITIIDFEKILVDINPQAGIQMSEISALGDRPSTAKPIMIAEDSPLLERMILEALDKAGYTNVICCSNGKEAWDRLMDFKNSGKSLESQISCLITDIEMPQMDGHRLTKLVKADEYLRKLPVIIFSSLINEEMKLKGDSLGATAQISKPEIGNLVTLIDKYIL
jgi:two-component system chemotaxis response regulator CheV